ncbi:MAG: tyrosine-type recombinase/integrase [Velocimicrobium sp.]
MECLKDNIINEVMLKMQFNIDSLQLKLLEKSLNVVLYNVDVVKMETELSTQLDDNEYLLNVYQMRRRNRLADNTIEQYMLSMKGLLTFRNKNIREITHNDIDFYLDYLRMKGNNPVSIDNVRRNISAVYTWFRKQEIVQANPVERVERQKQIKKPIDHLSGIEVEQIRNACETEREHAIFEGLLSTMCRVGELLTIKIEDIDFQTGDILILGEKNNEYRTVFLNDKARLWIKSYIGNRTEGDVFVRDKKPYKCLTEEGIRFILKKIAKRVTDRRIYPHLLRKTGATAYKEKGCSLESISKMLGHSNVAVTERWYAKTSTESLRIEHRKYA